MFVSQVTLDPVWFTVNASTLGRGSPTSVASAALLLPYLQVRGNAVHIWTVPLTTAVQSRTKEAEEAQKASCCRAYKAGSTFPIHL